MNLENREPLLEVAFPIVAHSQLNSLHGYSLYGAIKHQMSWVGECPHTLICTIAGESDGGKTIETQFYSQLLIRSPISKVSQWYNLAGKTLSVGEGNITLKIPEIRIIRAKSTLKARIVLIHLRQDTDTVPPDLFLEAVARQLEQLGIKGQASIAIKDGKDDRKVLQVKRRYLPGYGVIVSGLSDEDSITLQASGIGGKKKFGAGFFL